MNYRQPIINKVIPIRRLIHATLQEMHRRRAPKASFENYLSQELEAVAIEWRRVFLPSEPADSKLLFPVVPTKTKAKSDGRCEKKLSEADCRRIKILKVEHGLKTGQLAERYGTSTQHIRRVLESGDA